MLSFIILWKKWEYFQIYFESDNVPASKIKTLRALFLPDASAGKILLVIWRFLLKKNPRYKCKELRVKGFNRLTVKGYRPIECKVGNPFSSKPYALCIFLEFSCHLTYVLPENKRKGREGNTIRAEMGWGEQAVAECLHHHKQASALKVFCTESL